MKAQLNKAWRRISRSWHTTGSPRSVRVVKRLRRRAVRRFTKALIKEEGKSP